MVHYALTKVYTKYENIPCVENTRYNKLNKFKIGFTLDGEKNK